MLQGWSTEAVNSASCVCGFITCCRVIQLKLALQSLLCSLIPALQVQHTPGVLDKGSSDVKMGASAESSPEHAGGVQTPWHVLE